MDHLDSSFVALCDCILADFLMLQLRIESMGIGAKHRCISLVKVANHRIKPIANYAAAYAERSETVPEYSCQSQALQDSATRSGSAAAFSASIW